MKKARLCYPCAKSPATSPEDLDRYLRSRVMDKAAPCDRCGSRDFTKTFRPSRQEPPELVTTTIRTDELAELLRCRERLNWLHTGGGKDLEGYEWGVARVKFDANGQVVSVLWTFSDHSDLDREMEREANLENYVPMSRHGGVVRES